MPARLHQYEEPTPWSRGRVERALAENDVDGLLHAVVAVSLHEPDWRYAQDLCIRLTSHPHFNVRANAVLGFGHVARVQGKLDELVVMPLILAALRDENEYVQGHAEDTKADTEVFSDGSTQTPNQALEPTTLAVTIPASQEVAPARVVAHL